MVGDDGSRAPRRSRRRQCTRGSTRAPPVCPTCLSGQVCVPKFRECYPDNGVIGGRVSVTGTPDLPCAGTYSAPTLVSLACIPPAGASFINGALGLTGLGRPKLPVKMVRTP